MSFFGRLVVRREKMARRNGNSKDEDEKGLENINFTDQSNIL